MGVLKMRALLFGVCMRVMEVTVSLLTWRWGTCSWLHNWSYDPLTRPLNRVCQVILGLNRKSSNPVTSTLDRQVVKLLQPFLEVIAAGHTRASSNEVTLDSRKILVNRGTLKLLNLILPGSFSVLREEVWVAGRG